MRKKGFLSSLASALALLMLVTACGSGAAPADSAAAPDGASTAETPAAEAPAAAPTDGDRLTEVGTPRSETLIVDMLSGRSTNPDLFNWYMPGAVPKNTTGPFLAQRLWEIDTNTGEQYGEVAAELPRALDDTMTRFEFKVKEGLKWSDGVDFTANDVAFTSEMLLTNTELTQSAWFSSIIKSMTAVDDYTIQVETVNPEPRLTQLLGVTVHGNNFEVVPKHIWENEDPTTFKFDKPVSLSSYILKEFDPQGYWYLWEKREDWQNSLEGQKVGEPVPQYILQRAYGAEENKIMAAIQHDLDVLCSITPESWELLRTRSDTARAWFADFPYGSFDDPCERGIVFNMDKPPYDNPEVRWALTLAVDIIPASMNTYNGMLRASVLNIPPIGILQETYHKPMVDWLSEFAFEDGYKPYNANFAVEMTQYLTSQGIEGLPETEEAQKDMFGYGWWKFDPEKATELLTKNGFTQVDGKWMLPDGSPWQMDILSPKDFSIQSVRIAYAAAECWSNFGIDVNVVEMEAAAFWNERDMGTFSVGSYWPGCASLPDFTSNILQWHSEFYRPEGEFATNSARYQSAEADALIDTMREMSPDDPELIPTATELLKVFVKDMPNMSMFGSTVFIPTDDYYWTNFPTADNSYAGPWWWWGQFKYIVPYLEPLAAN